VVSIFGALEKSCRANAHDLRVKKEIWRRKGGEYYSDIFRIIDMIDKAMSAGKFTRADGLIAELEVDPHLQSHGIHYRAMWWDKKAPDLSETLESNRAKARACAKYNADAHPNGATYEAYIRLCLSHDQGTLAKEYAAKAAGLRHQSSDLIRTLQLFDQRVRSSA
jgi:hypothetical protein